MKKSLLACLASALFLLGTTTLTPAQGPPPALKAGAPKPIIAADDPIVAPTVDITVPSKPVKRGRQIVFGVKGIKDKPANLVTYTYVWIVSPTVEDMFSWPDNTQASFGTGDSTDPKHYDITLVANFVFFAADGKTPVLKTSTETVGVDVVDVNPIPPGPPPPPPGPSPDPNPNPGPAPAPNPQPPLPNPYPNPFQSSGPSAFENGGFVKAEPGARIPDTKELFYEWARPLFNGAPTVEAAAPAPAAPAPAKVVPRNPLR